MSINSATVLTECARWSTANCMVNAEAWWDPFPRVFPLVLGTSTMLGAASVVYSLFFRARFVLKTRILV